MKLVARAVTALALIALAAPALPCGFDKPHTTTTSAPAPGGAVAKADKGSAPRAQKATKAEKAKAPPAPRTASN